MSTFHLITRGLSTGSSGHKLLTSGLSSSIQFVHIGSGITRLTGSATLDFELVISQPFTWSTRTSITIGQDFRWNTGSSTLYYYRILGGCVKPSCDKTKIDGNDEVCNSSTSNGQRFIQIVAATSVSDLCTKLKEKGLTYPHTWPIKSVSRYTRPVFSDDIEAEEASGIDHSCVELVEESLSGLLECLELILDETVYLNLSANVFVQEMFLSYNGSGNIYLAGTVGFRELIAVGDGGMAASGEALIASSSLGYISSGSGTLSGVAVVLAPSWSYVAEGILQTSGEAYITSPVYFYGSSGSLTISGEAIGANTLIHRVSGTVYLDGSADVVGTGLGWEYVGTGELSLDSFAEISSEAYSWIGSGTINLNGTHDNSLEYIGDGDVTIDGISDCTLILAYSGSGGADGSGSAELLSEAFEWSTEGEIATSGDVDLFDYNLIVTGIVGTVFSLDSVEFPEFDETETLSLSTDTVTTSCGCDPLPLTLKIGHNIVNSNPLSGFLNRNGFSLPSEVDVHFATAENIWRNTLHFVGATEKWTIIFEWGCVSEIAGSELDGNMWKFGLFVRKLNLNTGEDFDTRLLYTFSILEPCVNDRLKFKFRIDTQNEGEVFSDVPVLVDTSTFYDDIGLFDTPAWHSRPMLKINISEISIINSTNKMDISPIFPKEFAIFG